MRTRHLYIIGSWLCVILGFGCSRPPARNEAEAKGIAEKEWRRLGWKGITFGECKFVDGAWSVSAHDDPPTVGGDATILIGTNGKIIRYIGGM